MGLIYSVRTTKDSSRMQYVFRHFNGSYGNISANSFIEDPMIIYQLEWKIEVPPGQNVRLEIEELNIPSTDGICTCGYFDIGTYNSGNEKEVRISHICEDNGPHSFLADGNSCWVYVLYIPNKNNSPQAEFLKIRYESEASTLVKREFQEDNGNHLFWLMLFLVFPLLATVLLLLKWRKKQKKKHAKTGKVDRISKRFMSKHLYIDKQVKKNDKDRSVKIKISSPASSSVMNKSSQDITSDHRKMTIPSGDYNNICIDSSEGSQPFHVKRLLRRSPHFPNYSVASSDTVFFHNTPEDFMKGRPSQCSRFLTVPEKGKSRPSSCVSYLTLEAVPETEVLNSCAQQPNPIKQFVPKHHFPHLANADFHGQTPFIYIQKPETIKRAQSMPYPHSHSYFRPIDPPEYVGRTMSMSGRPLKKIGTFHPMMRTLPGNRIGRHMSENITTKPHAILKPSENSWKTCHSNLSSHLQSSGSYQTCNPTDSDRYATAFDDSSIADGSAQVHFHTVDVRVEPRRASICTASLENLADRDTSTFGQGLSQMKSISISQSSFHTYKQQSTHSQEVLTFSTEDVAPGTLRAYTTQDLEMEMGSEMLADQEKTQIKSSMSPRSRRSLLYSTSHGLDAPSYIICDFTTQNGKTFHAYETNLTMPDFHDSDFPTQPLLDRDIISGMMEYDNQSFDTSGMLSEDSCYRSKSGAFVQSSNLEAVDINNNSQTRSDARIMSETSCDTSRMVHLDEGESMV